MFGNPYFCELISYATEHAHVNHQVFWDDLSDIAHEPNKVRKARQEEMYELAKHSVYEKVPIKESWVNTGKTHRNPVGGR